MVGASLSPHPFLLFFIITLTEHAEGTGGSILDYCYVQTRLWPVLSGAWFKSSYPVAVFAG